MHFTAAIRKLESEPSSVLKASPAGLAARPVLQVHDELILEAPSEEVPRLEVLIREVMEGAAQLKVRLAVDVGSGPDWLSAKG